MSGLHALLVVAALSAACKAPPAPAAQPVLPPSPPFEATSTIRELMQSIVEPSAQGLWDSVGRVSDAKGTRDLEPKSDEEWAAVRRHAVSLMESTNLLLIPGRHVARAGQQTLKADDATFPLNRKRHAKVIEQLTKAGAGVIAYDFQFTEQSDDEDADNALIEAVRASPRVVLGTFDLDEHGTTIIFGGGEGLEYSGATPGLTKVPNDSDGRIRRTIFRVGNVRQSKLVESMKHNRLPLHVVYTKSRVHPLLDSDPPNATPPEKKPPTA